jgi:hypothetical protein
MTKKEFEERFDKAINLLTCRKLKRGCCFALSRAFEESYTGYNVMDYLYTEHLMMAEHEDLFYTENYRSNGWYMGPLDEEHQEIRLNSLLLFKEYCLDSQIYRGL